MTHLKSSSGIVLSNNCAVAFSKLLSCVLCSPIGIVALRTFLGERVGYQFVQRGLLAAHIDMSVNYGH